MSLIINNKPVDDTSNVISLLHTPLSWVDGDHGTDVVEKPTQIVGHWTAGPEHQDGSKVVKNMKSRKSRHTGKPLRVGIHFVIAAPVAGHCMAPIYQSADPGLTRCVHVGSRVVNRQSIGIEVVNAADPSVPWANSKDRGVVKTTQLGKVREWTAFYHEQLDAFVWLCDVLCMELGIEKNTFLGDKRLDTKSLRSYNGVLEHWHVGGTNKLDAGGMLVQSLRGEGYTEVFDV